MKEDYINSLNMQQLHSDAEGWEPEAKHLSLCNLMKGTLHYLWLYTATILTPLQHYILHTNTSMQENKSQSLSLQSASSIEPKIKRKIIKKFTTFYSFLSLIRNNARPNLWIIVFLVVLVVSGGNQWLVVGVSGDVIQAVMNQYRHQSMIQCVCGTLMIWGACTLHNPYLPPGEIKK